MRRIGTRFSKDLGLRDSVLLGVGFIIGSGIFLFPITMASMAGTYSLLSWVIGGVFTIVTGFCFAENASRIPKAGGLYSYAHQELGNTIGFLAGWSFWIGYWLTISTETTSSTTKRHTSFTKASPSARLTTAILSTSLLGSQTKLVFWR